MRLAFFSLIVLVGAIALELYLSDPASNRFTVGHVDVSVDHAERFVTAQNATSGLTVGNYDSFDAPAGTSYQVPENETLVIAELDADPDTASDTVVYFGWATSHVENSASAPANAVTVAEITIPKQSEAVQVKLPVAASIPGLMYPWIRVTGPSSMPGKVTLIGYEQP